LIFSDFFNFDSSLLQSQLLSFFIFLFFILNLLL